MLHCTFSKLSFNAIAPPWISSIHIMIMHRHVFMLINEINNFFPSWKPSFSPSINVAIVFNSFEWLLSVGDFQSINELSKAYICNYVKFLFLIFWCLCYKFSFLTKHLLLHHRKPTINIQYAYWQSANSLINIFTRFRQYFTGFYCYIVPFSPSHFPPKKIRYI